MGEGAERRLCIDLPCLPRLQVLILPAGALRDKGHQVQSGAGDKEPTSLLPLCFLPRPWGGQSCPDLAQGQGSTSKVSLKVGENPRVGEGRGGEQKLLGWAGLALRTLTYKLGNCSSLLPPLPGIHSVTLGRSLLTSEPQLPHLENGDNHTSQGCCEN